MSDPFCRNCGHSKHDDDPGTGDYCFAIVQGPDGGICGCETWEEAFEEDFEDPYADQDDKEYQDAQEGILPAHAFSPEAGVKRDD